MIAVTRVLSGIWPTLSVNLSLNAKALSRNAEISKAYVEDPLVHCKASARFGTELQSVAEWVMEHPADFAIPLLMIHGEADEICPVKMTLSFFEKVIFADKELKIYPGGYHEPHNDIDYEQVMVDVERWIEQHL
ncbi:MAG: alpha/beta hydrolase [Anaerolineae bacterium]|nr:alpha/beta hydrolase [Anaerolineae bacterium]